MQCRFHAEQCNTFKLELIEQEQKSGMVIEMAQDVSQHATEDFCRWLEQAAGAATDLIATVDEYQALLQSSWALSRSALGAIASLSAAAQATGSRLCSDLLSISVTDAAYGGSNRPGSILEDVADGMGELILSSRRSAIVGFNAFSQQTIGRGLSRVSAGRSRRGGTEGNVFPFPTSDLSEEDWSTDDMQLESRGLADQVPPVRSVQGHSKLLAGLLLHQVGA